MVVVLLKMSCEPLPADPCLVTYFSLPCPADSAHSGALPPPLLRGPCS